MNLMDNSGQSVVPPPQQPAPPPSVVQPSVSSPMVSMSSARQSSSPKILKFIPLFLIIIIILLVGVLGSILYLVFFNSQPKKQSSLSLSQTAQLLPNAVLSGTIDFNGVAPQGSTITIKVRRVGESQMKTVISGIPAADQTPWSWGGAQANVAYELRAYLVSNGLFLAQSDALTLSAPASSQSLRINYSQSSPAVTSFITPTYIPLQPSPVPTTVIQTSISGTIGINGYIPTGSTLAVATSPQGQGQFTTVVSNIPAVDGASFTWNTAALGSSYDVLVYLMQNGAIVSQSGIMTISAPAANEVLNITSTATPPQPTIVGISGNITFNGTIPQNSYITLGYAPQGVSTFTSVPGQINPNNNPGWSINSVNSGSVYQVQAYLWVNNVPFAQTPILTVTAPAANEVLTFNMTSQPSGPSSSSITATCGGQQGGNYQANITYNINGVLNTAQQFQVTVGTSSQSNNVYSAIVSPTNPGSQQSLSTTYSLVSGVTYYVQYSYATCSTCSTFSPFSQSIQLVCG